MKKMIAWIEDDADLIHPIVSPLENDGFDVVVYRTAQDVVDNIEQLRDCNLILLDLIIPRGKAQIISKYEYEGMNLLDDMRNKYEINAPVVILSTASAVKRFTNIAHSLSVSDILLKPCLPSHLKQSVITALNVENGKMVNRKDSTKKAVINSKSRVKQKSKSA